MQQLVSPAERLVENEEYLRKTLEGAADVRFRHFSIGGAAALLLYVEGLTFNLSITEGIVLPLQRATKPPASLASLREHIGVPEMTVESDFQEGVASLLKGFSLLFVDGHPAYVRIDTQQWMHRPVSSPENEISLRGPRDSFVETLTFNLAMIRRRLPTPKLKVHTFSLGRVTQTAVNLIYLEGSADEALVRYLAQRLSELDAPYIFSSSQVEDYLSGERYSPFPVFQYSERPDRVVAGLLQGKVAMLVDNTPTVLVVPVTLSHHYQAPDDYYFSPPIALFARAVRTVGMLVTILAPPLYVAFATVNSGVLRVQLMLAITASREGVPYPPFMEVLVMEFMMEMISEATLRLPKVIGGTATIVGGLIIGQAASAAHIISNIMIVVTAASAIGNFTAPSYAIGVAWRTVKFGLILLAIPFGMFGIGMGLIALLFYFASLESFGTPYLSPLGPTGAGELARDSNYFRAPWKQLWKGPAPDSKGKGE